jgi:hypothetical protein
MSEQIEDQLRAELDGPAPPVQTSLSQVMSRGLRRRRIRQTGSLALSAAVVAGVGVLAMTLGGKDSTVNQPAISDNPVATSSGGPPRAPVWPQAALPDHTPYGTWTPGNTAPRPPAAPEVTIPMCDSPTGWLDFPVVQVPAKFGESVVQALRAAAPKSRIGDLTGELPPKAKSQGYRVDVRDGDGVGSLWIRAGTFTGKPLDKADHQAYDEGNCKPPQRVVQSDGTVLQIYPIRASEPFQTLSQNLMIYRSDGKLYSISMWSDGSVDVRPDPKQPTYWERIGKGRGTLPLTEDQLAVVGLAVANVN